MEIRDEPETDQFVAEMEEGEAHLEYMRQDNGVRNLLHTFVSPAEREQGVGAALVRFAMDHAREHGYKVIPSCPFVRAWLSDNPEYQDLVAERSG